jgi:hypothetical protein
VANDGVAYVYRVDVTPPAIECPEDLFVQSEPGGGAFVGFNVKATDDYTAAPTIECTPPSPSVFPMGSTTVTCRATDDVNNESTCEFMVHVLPDELFYRRGNVDFLARGPLDVLFVTGSPGDPVERTLFLSAADPLVMRVESPPSREGALARFALYVWLRVPTASTLRELPLGIGYTCLPTPLNPGGPQPKRIANNLGHEARLGFENWPGPPTSPAPTVLLDLPPLGRSLTLFAQGIIVDTESLHGSLAVTNGILVRVGE